MEKIRQNLYLSREAWEKLHKQNNMSAYVEELILGNDQDLSGVLELIKEMVESKDNESNDVKNSIMNILDI